MCRYNKLIWLRASLTLALLSLTIAENRLGLTASKTLDIWFAINSPVCDSSEKSHNWYKYSLRSGVIIIKFQ